LLCCSLFPQWATAGTTGTVTGTVHDEAGEPVIAATIRVEAQRYGAYSDAKGLFSILNVAPGTYAISVTRMGYTSVRIENVQVTADETTRLDVKMTEAALETDEVVVRAERPAVDLNVTSSKVTVSREEIKDLPVQELEDIVDLQAGVVDGHFRGGRLGEVQYQVDGASVNNAFDNTPSVKVDRSLLQEVQVLSGTFDAEYGQAMSGVVNAVLRDGTEDFRVNGEAFLGSHFYPGNSSRIADDTIRPTGIQNYQLGLSGPLPLPNTVFLLSGRRYVFDDWIYGTRFFEPTDKADLENKVYRPTGDGKKVPLGYSREWSGVFKLTNNSIKNAKINYQALFNHVDSRRMNYAFRYDPDGLSTQESFSISHGLDWTHSLGEKSYLKLIARQNYSKYTDYAYPNVYDARYDSSGAPIQEPNFDPGAVIQGVEFTRFKQETNTLLVKGSVLSQLSPTQQIKIGGEFQLPKVSFGTPGYLVFAQGGGGEALDRHVDEPPDYPGVRSYFPIVASAFAQEATEWTSVKIRAGFRLDYFNARSTVPSDLANPANSIVGAPTSMNVSTRAKVYASPRLGVAYPIEDKAAIHFAWGHFRQYPPIGEIFNSSDYSALYNLQAGDPNIRTMGNPDVRPEQTVQYEIGYKQTLGQDMGIDLTAFYKDIRSLIGVEFIETYNSALYARLTNVDFGNVLGFTIAFDHRQLGPFRLSMDYTWQQALGNASNPLETVARAEAKEDPRPRLVPFAWDQRHTFNLTAAISKPNDYSLSTVIKIVSGQPYTPLLDSGFGNGLETNSDNKPSALLIDLRAEKSLGFSGVRPSIFLRVFNLFDARYFNGAVFNSTGSPFYSRFPGSADQIALADPSRFYTPRRIELGIRFETGAW
jgi:outer membrane receptor protein involved in Fe transport